MRCVLLIIMLAGLSGCYSPVYDAKKIKRNDIMTFIIEKEKCREYLNKPDCIKDLEKRLED